MASSFEHDAADTTMKEASLEAGEKKEHGHGHEHSHSEAHAKIVGLGALTVGGATFIVDREGQVEAGKTTEFGVELAPGSAAAVPSKAWLANPDGTEVADPVSGEGHDQHWHFNLTPLMPVKRSKFVLQVGEATGTLDFARGASPCNGGILSVFKVAQAPEWRGFIELKLHGDAGDLELWLYDGFPTSDWKVVSAPRPLDIPKDTVVTLTFPNHGGKSIELRVRNGDKNEDEEGTPNMREGGKTNYFIFPGESGQDPEWLVGEKWRGLVVATFEADGKSYSCDPFVLVPHDAL